MLVNGGSISLVALPGNSIAQTSIRGWMYFGHWRNTAALPPASGMHNNLTAAKGFGW